MMKYLGMVGLAVVAAVGLFVLHTNAQSVLPGAQCDTVDQPGHCIIGQPSGVSTANGASTWTCLATAGGVTTAFCSVPTTSAPVINGSCDNNVYDTCQSGTLTNATINTSTYPAVYSWICAGSPNGGTSASCTYTYTAPPQSTIGKTATSIACYANDNCNTLQGQVCVNPGQTNSYCGFPANGSGSAAGQTISQIISSITGVTSDGKPENGECSGDVNHSSSTAESCVEIFKAQAAALGYQTQCNISVVNGSPFPDLYEASCSLTGTGLLGPAPAGASTAATGFIPYAMVGYNDPTNANMDSSPAWYTIPSGAAAAMYNNYGVSTPNGGVTGTGASSGSGTASASAGTSGGSSNGSTSGSATGKGSTANPGSQSSINNNISSALSFGLPGFNTVTSQIGSPNTTSASEPSGTTGGSCLAVAQTTITSSLQTLQGLAGVLSSSNASPGILSSIQNLINSVAQVISALAGCVKG